MPSLEKLAALTGRSMVVAATTGAAGFLSGMVLNAINQQSGLLETVPWNDPVVLRMGLLVGWLILAAVIARVLAHRPQGPRVRAWLSLVSLLVLAGSMSWGLVGSSRHGRSPIATLTPTETSETSPATAEEDRP
jgi:hypothetical protein